MSLMLPASNAAPFSVDVDAQMAFNVPCGLASVFSLYRHLISNLFEFATNEMFWPIISTLNRMLSVCLIPFA